MIQTSLARRSILGGFAALAASWSIMPPRAVFGSDYRLMSLWDEWQASRLGIDEAEKAMHSIALHVEKLAPRWPPGMSQAEAEARSDAATAAYKAADYSAHEQRSEELWERLRMAQDRMGQQEAESLLGVLLCVRVLASWRIPELWGRRTGLIDTIRWDLERLTADSGWSLPLNAAIEQWHREAETAVEQARREQIAAGVRSLHDDDDASLPRVRRSPRALLFPRLSSSGEVLVSTVVARVTNVFGRSADHRLVGLWQEWQARYLAWIQAHDILEALWPQWPGWRASPEERAAYTDAYTALQETREYTAARSRVDAAWEQVSVTEWEMADGEAAGLLGILVRARVISSWTCVNRRDQYVGLLCALRRDLEGMAAAQGPVPEINSSVSEALQSVEEMSRLNRAPPS